MAKFQVLITPAAGKALIAEALIHRPAVQEALCSHTIVVIKGTGNAYIAERLLAQCGEAFSTSGYYRGITVPAGTELSELQHDDTVIIKGVPQHGMTVFDAVKDLGKGDVLFKGANALNIRDHTCGILIGNPKGGTMNAVWEAHAKGVTVIHPVGLEKRVERPVHELIRMNEGAGLRMFAGFGETFTEADALKELYGVGSEILASGGVAGAEGAVWLLVSGEEEQIRACREGLKAFTSEAPFKV